MLTLASDFGSPYPAAMRGVIHEMTEDATLVDITHDLPRQDVRTAAFWLKELLPWFPRAVHCCVVDPGVGTDRHAVVVLADGHALVGPDNGLLAPVARCLGTDPEWYRITEIGPASSTFHGRDVFAPWAARVHEAGIGAVPDMPDLRPLHEPVDLQFPTPEVSSTHAAGEVLVIDDFGNLITNIPGDYLAERMGDPVTVNGKAVPTGRAYAAVSPEQRLVTVGSHGNVELAVNQGRGDEAFDLGVGESVLIE
jgi:S-adenosylmethionine hydrolase